MIAVILKGLIITFDVVLSIRSCEFLPTSHPSLVSLGHHESIRYLTPHSGQQ